MYFHTRIERRPFFGKKVNQAHRAQELYGRVGRRSIASFLTTLVKNSFMYSPIKPVLVAFKLFFFLTRRVASLDLCHAGAKMYLLKFALRMFCHKVS